MDTYLHVYNEIKGISRENYDTLHLCSVIEWQLQKVARNAECRLDGKYTPLSKVIEMINKKGVFLPAYYIAMKTTVCIRNALAHQISQEAIDRKYQDAASQLRELNLVANGLIKQTNRDNAKYVNALLNQIIIDISAAIDCPGLQISH